MQSKNNKNTHESKKDMKYAGADTLVLGTSLLIIFLFLFINGSGGQVFGINEMFGTMQVHGL